MPTCTSPPQQLQVAKGSQQLVLLQLVGPCLARMIIPCCRPLPYRCHSLPDVSRSRCRFPVARLLYTFFSSVRLVVIARLRSLHGLVASVCMPCRHCQPFLLRLWNQMIRHGMVRSDVRCRCWPSEPQSRVLALYDSHTKWSCRSGSESSQEELRCEQCRQRHGT